MKAVGQEGQLKVHTLDQGTGPILFSVETLISLGAITDFALDMVVFKLLNSQRAVPPLRSR